MYSESFKPPRPGGVTRQIAEDSDVRTFTQNEIDSGITVYKTTPEYQNNFFYNEVGFFQGYNTFSGSFLRI